jgi:hypothetical protein
MMTPKGKKDCSTILIVISVVLPFQFFSFLYVSDNLFHQVKMGSAYLKGIAWRELCVTLDNVL